MLNLRFIAMIISVQDTEKINMSQIKYMKDFIIVIISLILAYFIINILWTVAIILIQIVFILIIAFILYLFLKRLL